MIFFSPFVCRVLPENFDLFRMRKKSTAVSASELLNAFSRPNVLPLIETFTPSDVLSLSRLQLFPIAMIWYAKKFDKSQAKMEHRNSICVAGERESNRCPAFKINRERQRRRPLCETKKEGGWGNSLGGFFLGLRSGFWVQMIAAPRSCVKKKKRRKKPEKQRLFLTSAWLPPTPRWALLTSHHHDRHNNNPPPL